MFVRVVYALNVWKKRAFFVLIASSTENGPEFVNATDAIRRRCFDRIVSRGDGISFRGRRPIFRQNRTSENGYYVPKTSRNQNVNNIVDNYFVYCYERTIYVYVIIRGKRYFELAEKTFVVRWPLVLLYYYYIGKINDAV